MKISLSGFAKSERLIALALSVRQPQSKKNWDSMSISSKAREENFPSGRMKTSQLKKAGFRFRLMRTSLKISDGL